MNTPTQTQGGEAATPRTDAKFRGAFPVLAGHCKHDEVVVLKAQFEAVADKAGRLERELALASAKVAEGEALKAVFKIVSELANDAPELNMGNYDDTQVAILNDFMTAIHKQCTEFAARMQETAQHLSNGPVSQQVTQETTP